jgi:hypothetical protein
MLKEFYACELGDVGGFIVRDANGKAYPHALACHIPSGWILQHSFLNGQREHAVSLETDEEFSKTEVVVVPAPLTVTKEEKL